jgi:hypothetical protein
MEEFMFNPEAYFEDLIKKIEEKGSVEIDLRITKFTIEEIKKHITFGKPYEIEIITKKGKRPIRVRIKKVELPEPDHIDFSEIERQILYGNNPSEIEKQIQSDEGKKWKS